MLHGLGEELMNNENVWAKNNLNLNSNQINFENQAQNEADLDGKNDIDKNQSQN